MSKQKVAIKDIPSLNERRALSKKKFHPKDLRHIQPKTKTQEQVFYDFNTGHDVMGLFGSAGTGKSFISLFLALREVLDPDTPYKSVKLVRTAVPTRETGFLPGTLEEKIEVYEHPYMTLCNDLFDYNSRCYENLKELGYIEFVSTSYLRGQTFDHSIVIFDECQSASFHELDTVMTRVGVYSKILFCGDTKQNDLLYKKNDTSGLTEFMKVLDNMRGVAINHFTLDDCVRSGLVYDYMVAKEAMNL